MSIKLVPDFLTELGKLLYGSGTVVTILRKKHLATIITKCQERIG